MRHILSVDQFTKDDLIDLIRYTSFHRKLGISDIAHGKILTNLFYEASTRTSSSFYAAMTKMGGHVIPINDVNYSSVSKGETLEDTIQTMQCYSDVIVLRHPEIGAANRAAAVAQVPIINAGDGTGEHPTQALLDLYTIIAERTSEFDEDICIDDVLNGLTITMMGDLKHGRTVKSLSKLLRNFNVKINWVSPEILKIPQEYLDENEHQTTNLDDVIHSTDVLYLTRVQKERFSTHHYSADEISKIVGSYMLGLRDLAAAKSNMVLMHPLPRTTELPTSLDSDPRSAYFRQMRYGLFMRMAVIQSVL